MAVQNLRIALNKAVFALGFKKRFITTLLCSLKKSCLYQKLFVTHSSVGNRVKVRTEKQSLLFTMTVYDKAEELGYPGEPWSLVKYHQIGFY